MRVVVLASVLALTHACATPAHALDEGSGNGGRSHMTTGLDAKDITEVGDGVLATLVQIAVYAGCWITAGDDCSIRAENAGREVIGRPPREIAED